MQTSTSFEEGCTNMRKNTQKSSITDKNDYDEGDQEFVPFHLRKQQTTSSFKRSKEDAIYGIFAEDMGSFDDYSKQSSASSSSSSVYFKPMRFVSGGKKIIGDKDLYGDQQKQLDQDQRSTTSQRGKATLTESQIEELTEEEILRLMDEDDGEVIDEDGDVEMTFSSPASATATTTTTTTTTNASKEVEQKPLSNADFKNFFASPNISNNLQKQQQQEPDSRDIAANENEKSKKKNYIITAAKKPTTETVTSKVSTLNDETTSSGTRSNEEAEKKQTAVKKDKDWASFLDNKVGNNVVRMMRKMGYGFNGTGLGPDGSGIVNPIKVIHTGKHHAVIVSDHHVHTTTTVSDEQEREQEEQRQKQEEEDQPRVRSWRRDEVAEIRGRKKQKKTTQFRTAEEVINEKRHKKQQLQPNYEIIDMTGQEARVIQSMDQLQVNRSSVVSSTSRVLPELQYNVRELVGMTEASIQDLDQKIRREKDKFSELDRQRTKLEDTTQKQVETIASFREVLKIVSKCFERLNSSESPLSLETLHDVFEMIQFKHRDIYFKYDIGQCAVALASPLIKHRFEDWKPLEQPLTHSTLLHKWKKLLSLPDDQKTKEGEKKRGWRQELLNQKDEPEKEDHYEKLTEIVVLPKIRSAFIEWKPTMDFEPAISLVENFVKPLLPEPMIRHIIEQLVISKLANTVENEWNATDVPLIHTWIHPWLPVLGQEYFARMEQYGIFPAIRRKITSSLQNWDPSDQSAHALLSPWKHVFDAKDFNKILMQIIVPKLIYTIRENLVIDPSAQDLHPFQQVILWADTLPSKHMVMILESEFFPKWNYVLYDWLLQPERDFDQVSRWFFGWKSLFPENVASSRKIQMQFNRGMDMINQAVSGQEIIPSHTLTPPSVVLSRDHKEKQVQQQVTEIAEERYELSFKELIERYAAENDLIFVPKDGKANGKQLYSFAGLTTYIDNDCLYLKDSATGVWKPVTLDEYLQHAEKNNRAK